MLRVTHLDRSLAFYAKHFGLQELRRIHMPEKRRTLVFIGTPGADPHAMQLELWHEPSPAPETWSHSRYHIGINVPDIDAFVARLQESGIEVLQPVAALRPGGRRLTMIIDPDGHELELLSMD